MNRKRVGILLYREVEVLDFGGPFEVFSVTRLDEAKRRDEPSPFDVSLIAESSPVRATGGMKVIADYGLDDCPPLDILVVPGGWGSRSELENQRLIDWIADRSRAAETFASVCTGALLVGKTGLLDGRRATTHWRFLDSMQQMFPDVTVDRQRHFTQDGNFFSSAGISAGIDMAIKIVVHYYGESIARMTARHMEYPYPESDARRIALS